MSTSFSRVGWLAVLACLSLPCTAVLATDVDGPDDCLRDLVDYGDAPECVPAYPSGVIGQFPTCMSSCGAGTQTTSPLCPPLSTPPGPTGFVRHVQFGPDGPGNFWLGCYGGAGGPFGIDTEPDGKTGSPASGVSACSAAGLPTDCAEAAFGMTFDQDECWLDGSDAGIPGPPLTLLSCTTTSIPYMASYCGTDPIQVFLNILIDFDADADWNDVPECPDLGCAPEWVVMNAPIALMPGCTPLVSPPFLVGPRPGPSWLRISLTLEPVPPDYPWAGSAGMAGGEFIGGETEDYPLQIDSSVPTEPRSWGQIKSRFR